MNLTVLCKRIMGLFLLIFVASIFSLVPVQAADKVKCEKYLTNVKFVTRYNVSMEEAKGSGDNYTISLHPNSSDTKLQSALRKVVFKVVKINNTVQDGSKTVKYNKPITIPGQYVKNAIGDKEMIVTLESTESNADPACYGKVTFKVGITKGGDEVIVHEKFDPIEDEFGQTDGMAIDCGVPQTDSFNQEFCKAKNAVVNNSSNSKFDYSDKFKYKDEGWETFQDLINDKEGEERYAQLKCDVNKFDTTNGYYVNTSYLYGSGLKTVNNGHYTYHYSPGVSTEGDSVKCKVKCEEAVTVEYGPPIASKAGLCFEYKVKVTSRVSCNMSEKPKLPKYEADYCTPTPLCKSSESSVIVTNQGGPNEDFDTCIKACDGGKYTDKCTDKCYKRVYGTTNNKKTGTAGDSYKVEKLADAVEEDLFSKEKCVAESEYHGCYYRKDGAIYWEGQNVSTPGRWYLISPHKDLSEYGVFGNGIYRHKYSGGAFCHDICWWSGCSNTNVYLNPGIAKKDYEKNKKLYKETVSACKATATCTTTTAEFTISTRYTDGTNKVKEIVFPYTANNDGKDQLTSKGKGDDTGVDTSTSNTTTILDYSGCYKKQDAYRIYMTEWSFPGTWIHNKTGEISYVNKGNDKSWQTIKNKFCIPLNAKDVNEKWWNYYYYKVLSSKNSSITSEAYQKNCADKGYGFKKVETFDEANIDDWNITAKTENFGYFGWNIQISCFYALNTNSKVTDTSKDVPAECQTGSQSYRIRSADLKNLFPATDGTVGQSRTPGFNWSEYATLTKTPEKAENAYYTINPAKYAEEVQSLGDSVYNTDYLDYEINLTRSVISELKKKNHTAENNSSDSDETITTNYVVNYHSPLFRNGGILSNSKYPDESSLKCNNMVRYDGGCAK